MSEDFLHFIWQFQQFDKQNIATTTGQSLQILSIGQRNAHAGPDFLNARIVIGDIEWAGNVEIHINASDWLRHNHAQDAAYNNVILHVVWQDDTNITRLDGTLMPTLNLQARTAMPLLRNYTQLLQNTAHIPCLAYFKEVLAIHKHTMLDRALMQRLEHKANWVHQLLEQNQQDWEETAYQLLVNNFGFKINAEPMLRLAQSIPFKILKKHANQPRQIEALLLGQAGFLDHLENEDDYSLLLKKEYEFLAKKYDLESRKMAVHEWRFLRLRPANFPTVRLAQLAALIQYQNSLFSVFIYSTDFEKLANTLKVSQSSYWKEHYLVGKKSAQKVPTLGKSSIENIIINTAVPLLVAYSQAKDNRDYLDKAISLLEQLPAEQNHITDLWKSLDLTIKTASDSQGSIEWYNNFCMQKKCLNCSVGVSILKQTSTS